MKIGCCIKIKNVALAKKIGYDFVELSASDIMKIEDDNWKQTKEKILAVNIPVIGFNSFCSEKYPIVGSNVNEENLYEYFDKILQRANDLGCHNIGIGAPKARMITKDFAYDIASKQMEAFLYIAANKASVYNINILYEALHPKSCNFGNSTCEIYDTVKRLDMPNLKLVWDVYHSVNAGERYQELVHIFDLVEHVHICSWDKQLQRFYLLREDQKYVDELFVYLNSQKYMNSISIEAGDKDFESIGKQSLEMIQQSIKIVESEG